MITSKKMYKKLLGRFGVDSGQVLITDPCYLDEWKANEFKDIREYKHKKTGKILKYPKHFTSYDDVIKGYGKSMNQMLADKEVIDLARIKDSSYSYNGACNVSLYDKKQGGEVGLMPGIDGVVARTGYGDGCYPVYATYENGRIMKLEIDFA